MPAQNWIIKLTVLIHTDRVRSNLTERTRSAPLSNFAITQALPRIAAMPQADGLFVESLMSSIAQGDDAAKERVRAFLEKRATKVSKS